MMHYQPAIIQNVNQNQELNQSVNLEASKTITVNVIGTTGQAITSYTITGMMNQKVGDKLKDQSNVIQVLNNGEITNLQALRNMDFSQLSNTITVMSSANMSINSQYTLNGKLYNIGQTQGDYITTKGAKIYVPSNILKDKNNTMTSVSINNIQYNGVIDGNYVLVKGDIPAIATNSNSVVVNFQNSTVHNYTTKPVVEKNDTVQVVQMNQYGQEISSQTINDANGYALANVVANAKHQITSMTYNSQIVTLMDLLTQSYPASESNVFVINEYTQSPINLHVSLFGRLLPINNTQNDIINSNNVTIGNVAKFNLPTGLVRNFKVESVNINGVQYKGHLEGSTYVINEFIPDAPIYDVTANLIR